MAKKEFKMLREKGGGRKNQVRKCETCNGKPETVSFDIEASAGKRHKGVRCAKPSCMLVISWEEYTPEKDVPEQSV